MSNFKTTELSKKNQKYLKQLYENLADRTLPKLKEIFDWNDLVIELKRNKLTPKEAFKIFQTSNSNESRRFKWKMLRLIFYIWERIREDKYGYLKPKIDTVRKVIKSKEFQHFCFFYTGENPPNIDLETKRLFKLITEERTIEKYFLEGLYYYENSTKIIPQKHLDYILRIKK